MKKKKYISIFVDEIKVCMRLDFSIETSEIRIEVFEAR